MNKKFVIVNTLVTAVVLAVFFTAGLLLFNLNNIATAESTVIEMTQIYCSTFDGDYDFEAMSDASYRITIISEDGTVIADSEYDAELMENHADRAEIIAAASGNNETVERYSDTIGVTYIYYAQVVELESGETVFVRFSLQVDTVEAYINAILPGMFVIFFVLVGATCVFSYLSNRRLLKPIGEICDSLEAINDGTFENLTSGKFNKKSTEYDIMFGEISEIGQKLKKNFSNIKMQKRKLEYIMDNISDAIFVIDGQEKLAMINEKASALFELRGNFIGKNINYITNNKEIIKLIKACMLDKNNVTAEVLVNDTYYSVTLKSINQKWKTNGDGEMCLVIMTDINEKRINEDIRSEFFANASHELKTPLTSVSGFSELLAQHNKDEKLNKYISKIQSESQRMMRLIEDMLGLSALEQKAPPECENVKLVPLADDIILSLKPIIDDKKLSVLVSGEAELYIANMHIYELLKNLIENAAKYNVDGGEVNIDFKKIDNKTIITVQDTGIGIDFEHQTRVFERFYRVEKSRSRASGGTGLGLSIVKHICNIYNADIKVYSKKNFGTRVVITF